MSRIPILKYPIQNPILLPQYFVFISRRVTFSLLALFYHPKVWEYCRWWQCHPPPSPSPTNHWLICIPPQSPMWPFPFVTWPVRALQLHQPHFRPSTELQRYVDSSDPTYQRRKAGILQISYPLINIPLFFSFEPHPTPPLYPDPLFVGPPLWEHNRGNCPCNTHTHWHIKTDR